MNKPMINPSAESSGADLRNPQSDQTLQVKDAPADVTVVQADVPEILTKRISLKEGILKKEGGGVLVSGYARVCEVTTLSEFAELLTSLGPDQALIYGRPEADEISLTTKDDWERRGKPRDVIPRTNETFSWPDGPGILMLDYDPSDDGTEPLSPQELIDTIKSAAPGLSSAEMLTLPSASSWIENTETGELLQEQSGQRVYLMVEDARDIPRAGSVLFERLWLTGHGYMKVSSAGSLLSRSLIDEMVWQPSRLDFAAGAECEGPLVQDRGEPILIAGDVTRLDTAKALPDLAPHEQKTVEALKKQASEEKSDEAAAARADWLNRQVRKMVGNTAGEDEMARAKEQAEAALEGGPLSSDFVLEVETENGIEAVTVAKILSAPERYDRAKTRDPLEPEYDDGRLVGMLFLAGSVKTLHSFARGGASYQLAQTVENIQVMAGQLSEAVEETLAVLRDHPSVFDYGDELVLQEAGRLHPLSEHSLNQFLGSAVQYTKADRQGKLLKVDPPPNLARRILALRDRRRLKPLSGVITAPTLRLDGTVLDTPGYDPETKLVYDAPEKVGDPVPLSPGVEDCRVALETLWCPFREFPFVDVVDKSVMLSALLTAAVRPVLPTAPAFAFDAPIQGSGKSLLAACVSAMAGEPKPSVHPHACDEDEIRKRLLAVLRSGTRAIVWDNVLGEFNSASMAALLTSPEYSDRVLGVSQSVTLPNRLLVTITGNNLVLAGDLPRRVMVSRIDPQTDAPHAREFDLNPLGYVLGNRSRLIQSALLLMRGWWSSASGRPEGRMASFEDWNDLVRNTVAWIGDAIESGRWVDPMEAITRGVKNDPENDALSELLAALEENFGHETFCSKDVMNLVAPFRDPTRRRSSATDGPEFRLYEALITLNEQAVKTTASLGKTLKFRKDRMVGGRVLRQSQDAHTKTSQWRIAEV